MVHTRYQFGSSLIALTNASPILQLTYRSGFADDVRAQFASNHSLDNTEDPNFRAVSDRW